MEERERNNYNLNDLAEMIQSIQNTVDRVEKVLVTIPKSSTKTNCEEELPTIINTQSVMELNEFAKKGSVRLLNLMKAFTVPSKFLLALADYVVWKHINYKTILNASHLYDLMISIYTDGTSDGTNMLLTKIKQFFWRAKDRFNTRKKRREEKKMRKKDDDIEYYAEPDYYMEPHSITELIDNNDRDLRTQPARVSKSMRSLNEDENSSNLNQEKDLQIPSHNNHTEFLQLDLEPPSKLFKAVENTDSTCMEGATFNTICDNAMGAKITPTDEKDTTDDTNEEDEVMVKEEHIELENYESELVIDQDNLQLDDKRIIPPRKDASMKSQEVDESCDFAKLVEMIKTLQESVNRVEKSVNAISRPPDKTLESEVLPPMLNEHSLGEFNKLAEADSVVLHSFMRAFPLPTKFLQALADFEVWSNINYDTFAKNSFLLKMMKSVYTNGTKAGEIRFTQKLREFFHRSKDRVRTRQRRQSIRKKRRMNETEIEFESHQDQDDHDDGVYEDNCDQGTGGFCYKQEIMDKDDPLIDL